MAFQQVLFLCFSHSHDLLHDGVAVAVAAIVVRSPAVHMPVPVRWPVQEDLLVRRVRLVVQREHAAPPPAPLVAVNRHARHGNAAGQLGLFLQEKRRENKKQKCIIINVF